MMLKVKLTDLYFLVKCLSPLKIWNILALTISYGLSRFSGKSLHSGMPASLAIEPTTACNLNCPECPAGQNAFKRPTGRIELADYQYYVAQIKRYAIYLTIYFQGEPFMHPDIFKMISFADKNRIYTSISTNAHFLKSDQARDTVLSGLKRMIISLDGIDQDTYAAYRAGGNIDQVLEGIKNIVRYKKKLRSRSPRIILQFLVLKSNEHQIADVNLLGKALGVDEVRFKSAQFHDFKQGNPLMPVSTTYSRYKRDPDGTYSIKSALPSHCWRMWSSAVISWDGRVLPCCFDKDAENQLGFLGKEDFREIWKGKDYMNFRKRVFTQRAQIDICRNCTSGLSRVKVKRS